MINMRTRIFSVCMGIFCLICAQSFAQTFPFKIDGTLKNISPLPAKMYLKAGIKGVLQKDSDSTPVVDGHYLFQGQLNVDEGVVVVISTEPKPTATNSLSFFLDKGELSVVSDSSLKNIKVTGPGAVAQHELDEIKDGVKKEKAELQRITNSEEYKNNQQMQADILKRSQALGTKGLNDLYSFLKNNPDKRSAPFETYLLTVTLPIINGEKLDTVLAGLPQHVKNDALGKALMEGLAKRDSVSKVAATKSKIDADKIQIGTRAPDFTQPDVNNKSVSLSSFKGKYVLVDFWASWCAPCRAENPNVVKAYNKYKEKGFTVLGVSLDAAASRAAWLKAITADGLRWTQVSDLQGWKNEAAVAYGVSAIPQNFLIDPNGVVIGKNLRGEELNAKLASLFK